jgi:hypothetical protein
MLAARGKTRTSARSQAGRLRMRGRSATLRPVGHHHQFYVNYTMEQTIDLENKLPICLPGMLELLNNKTFKPHEWKKINTNLQEQLIERRKKIISDNYLKVETNIYDIIVGVIEGKTSPYGYFQYLHILFKRLTKNLNVQERKKLRPTLYSVLINLDHKYRNFIGELSVLNNIRENNKEYRLINVDKEIIVDEKKADFTFENIYTKEIELFEVVNIHAYDVVAGFDLKRFVVGKIEDKIRIKTNGKSDYRPFKLVPVFWGQIKDMKKLNEIFKNGKVDLPNNVFEPMSLCSFNGPDFPVHRFVKISELSTDGPIEVIPYNS